MSKIVIVSYANSSYYESALRLKRSIKKYSDFDYHYAFAPWDIDQNFEKSNTKVLTHKEGDGWWLWKPYFIKQVLNQLEEGDIILYMDSGVYLTESIKPLMDYFISTDLPLMCFTRENHKGLSEQRNTKRDCLITLGCDEPKYWQSSQRVCTYHLWRKCKTSLLLVDEWLYYCQFLKLIDNSASKHPEYDEFQNHSNDQSIFSLLTKKYDIPATIVESSGVNKIRLNDMKTLIHPIYWDQNKKNRRGFLKDSDFALSDKINYLFFKSKELSYNLRRRPLRKIFWTTSLINRVKRKIIGIFN